MVIEGFGIQVRQLQQAHLPLLRQWRNSEYVRRHMQYREHITEQMQQQWFSSLVASNSYYFMIHNGENYVGCCNIKNIDPVSGIGEGGVFFGEERYARGLECTKAAFLVYDWAFSNNIFLGVKAEILADNRPALRFNQMLGFEITRTVNGVSHGQLCEDNFRKAYHRYAKVFSAQ